MVEDGAIGAAERTPAEGADIDVARLRALSVAVAAVRQRLADGAAPDRADLDRLLAALPPPEQLPKRSPAVEGALLALLDEIGGLIGQLELERDATRVHLLSWGRHRHAQASYANRRPRP